MIPSRATIAYINQIINLSTWTESVFTSSQLANLTGSSRRHCEFHVITIKGDGARVRFSTSPKKLQATEMWT